MRQLHYSPGTASMAPHILLEEMGVPFELVTVDLEHHAHKSAAYLRLNPNGRIPVYVEGDLVLYESAAICLHLCDSVPQAGLIPALGTAQRANCYKWLMWMTNTLQAELLVYFYPERWTKEGNTSGAAELKSCAEARIGALLAQLDAEIERAGGPWFLGTSYSLLDPFCLMLCRWTRGFERVTKASDRTHLGPYLRRVLARPAVTRAYTTEQIGQPWG